MPMEEQQGTEENEVLGQEGEQRVRSEAGGMGVGVTTVVTGCPGALDVSSD